MIHYVANICTLSFLVVLSSSSIVVESLTGTDFNSVLDDLTSGNLLQWIAMPAQCTPLSSSENAITIPGKLVATIDDWEYFYDPRFTPQKYFATSIEHLVFDENGDGDPYYRLTTLRFYDNNTVELSFETISPSYPKRFWVQTGFVSFSCSLEDDSIQMIHKGGPSLTWNMLHSLDDVMNAIDGGARVTYVTRYANCSVDSSESMGAIGGSSLDQSYELETDMLKWKKVSLIKDYQSRTGKGYVYDAVEANANFSSGMINFTASDITTTTYSETYIETFTCEINIAVTFYADQ
jgi:hypothetical protein